MLVITRTVGTSVDIGDDIKVTILSIKNHQVRIGIDAPKELAIKRDNIINDKPNHP